MTRGFQELKKYPTGPRLNLTTLRLETSSHDRQMPDLRLRTRLLDDTRENVVLLGGVWGLFR